MPVIPATQEAEAGELIELGDGGALQPGQQSKTPSQKEKKSSQVWWRTPVIPAAWVAEAGESLEPRRQRLQ